MQCNWELSASGGFAASTIRHTACSHFHFHCFCCAHEVKVKMSASSKFITDYFQLSTKTTSAPSTSNSASAPATSDEDKKGRGKALTKNKVFSDELRSQIGKYAAETSNSKASEKYVVAESTVRCFKKKYLAQLKQFAKDCGKLKA